MARGCGCLGGCLGTSFKVIFAFMALSVAASVLKQCGVITGDIEKDTGDAYSNAMKRIEEAKPYLKEPAQEVQRMIGSDVPIISDVTKSAVAGLETKYDFNTEKVPVGRFTVDMLALSGPNKQFSFDVRGQDNQGDVRIEITEYGSSKSELGENLKFNVVFFEPDNNDKKGIGFSLTFHHKTGCVIGSYDSSLRSLVYVGEGDRFCVEMNGKSKEKVKRPVIFSTILPRLIDGETLMRDLPQYVKPRFVNVPPKIKASYSRADVPIEIPYAPRKSILKAHGIPVNTNPYMER